MADRTDRSSWPSPRGLWPEWTDITQRFDHGASWCGNANGHPGAGRDYPDPDAHVPPLECRTAELAIEDARDGLTGEGRDLEIIDVREPAEWEIVSIDGATLVPKNEFLMGDALTKLPQDKQIVLHCKSGARSAEVLAVLKAAGFSDAVHVGGGVLAWVNQVDPSLPTY